MLKFYILENAQIKEVDFLTLLRWELSVGNSDNHCIAATNLFGGVWVSTIFLTFNHNWHEIGPPVLFETMIFGGPLDRQQERYTSLDAALSGHERNCGLALRAWYNKENHEQFIEAFLREVYD